MRLRNLEGIPEVTAGMGLPALLARLAATQGVVPGDVLAIAHKIISKDEGRVVRLADVVPGPQAQRLAAETGKRPQTCELILRESRRIVRRRGGTLICETKHGFVCANAAIDLSNTAQETAVLLPVDPDASARRVQAAVSAAVGGRVGVIITDTHGRAFRRGIVNVAVGVAGMEPILDHRGSQDREGRVLVATEQAVADELAAASGVLMPKAGGTPVVIISGVVTEPGPGGAGRLVRAAEHDLFRG